jgi:hypothetical protein
MPNGSNVWMIREEYARRIATWEQWNDLAERAHGSS